MTVKERRFSAFSLHSHIQCNVPAILSEQKAQFATSSRLLASLVNERWVHTALLSKEQSHSEFLKHVDPHPHREGDTLLFTSGHVSVPILHWAKLTPPHDSSVGESLFIPLRKLPVSQATAGSVSMYFDPDDIVPSAVFWIHSCPSPEEKGRGPESLHFSSDACQFKRTLNPLTLWDIVGCWHHIAQSHPFQVILNELRSTVHVQDYYFKNTHEEPYFGSPAITWEKAIVEGHPTHPVDDEWFELFSNLLEFNEIAIYMLMHSPLDFDYDCHFLENPKILFVSLPKVQLHCHGLWETQIHPYFVRFVQQRAHNFTLPAEHALVPVHILQWKYLQSTFPNRFEVVPEVEVPAAAQASTRTLVPLDPTVCFGYLFKLPLCVVISSALRTVSKFSIRNGPVLSQWAEAVVNTSVCRVLKEEASAGLVDDDEHVAKLLGCILRVPEPPLMYICAALFEPSTQSGVPRVVEMFKLHTPALRRAFLERYVHTLLRAVLPAVFRGFALEAHPQNMLVQLNATDAAAPGAIACCEYTVVGFGVRDFGGVMIHPPLLPDTARWLPQLDTGSQCLVQDMPALYALAYHTLIFCHVHRLVRVLDLHADRSGWRIVYRLLQTCFEAHPGMSEGLEKAWFHSPTMRYKSFLKMKMNKLYRDYIYDEVPNLILLGAPVESSP